MAESKKRPILFKYDNHLNPGAHALIGREITEILRPLVEERAGKNRGAAAEGARGDADPR